MIISAKWFQIAGTLIVPQVVLGTLVSNDFVDPTSHEALGFPVLFMTVSTMVVARFSKPSSRSLLAGSGLLVPLVALQVSLGLDMFESGSSLLSAAQIANTTAIPPTAFVGFYIARRPEAGIRL
ncbi:MAG: hypothetical protein JRN06_06645 [Nitrososphaerota archaeon]|nr:hypothetical protein [Nitrososphaerota archaeon]MDG7024544.1 hypothetical protein [Nitrososphaerota archaeon]